MMLKIKDNLFMKSKVKCITYGYSELFNRQYLNVKFINDSVEVIWDAIIDDVIDLDRKGDK